MPTGTLVAAFRRHFSVVEILIIESFGKTPRHKGPHFIEIYLKSEVNDTDPGNQSFIEL